LDISVGTLMSWTMDAKLVGRKIRELRMERDWEGKVLGAKVGVTQAQVSYIETGKQAVHSVLLLKIAKALDVPPAYFFIEADEPSDSEITRELKNRGLTPSSKLRRAMSNPGFLKFVEECAKAVEFDGRNLARMGKRMKRVTKGAGAPQSARRAGSTGVGK